MNVQPNDLLTHKLQTLIANGLQLPSEQITFGLSFGDIPQWDSMGHMEIMLLLEAEYGVEINPNTITTLTSIERITRHLKENGYA